jgi:hypothetical protein
MLKRDFIARVEGGGSGSFLKIFVLCREVVGGGHRAAALVVQIRLDIIKRHSSRAREYTFSAVVAGA